MLIDTPGAYQDGAAAMVSHVAAAPFVPEVGDDGVAGPGRAYPGSDSCGALGAYLFGPAPFFRISEIEMADSMKLP